MPIQTDIIIIGAGPGGYRAAELAAKRGRKVVIIEAAHVGGTCLNEGCIPTKCYARNAEAVSLVRDSEALGICHDGFDFFLGKAKSRKDEVIEQLRTGIEAMLSHPNITFIRAEARFVDAHTVEAYTAGGDSVAAMDSYTAPAIIVATGSVPKTLPIEGAALALDSSDLLQMERQPDSLCIVGAGVIGMEFASIFSAFGTKVTVVEFLKECLPALDSDIAKRLRKVLEKRGVDFCMQCTVKAISGGNGGGKTVFFEDKKGREQTVEAEQVLMAVGRAPRVFEHFSKAGFEYDKRSGIRVDSNFETTVPGVYAIGDVNGLQMLAHAAEAQAKMVIDHIIEARDEASPPSIIPAAIFTAPEAACVGKTEDQLKAEGAEYECRKAFHRANGKALAMNEAEGMVKLFSEPGAGRIIGCHAFGAHSADIVQEACALMYRDTTVEQLRHIVHIHPTLSEILLAAAETDK